MTFIEKEIKLLTALKDSGFKAFSGDKNLAVDTLDKVITAIISCPAKIAKDNIHAVLEQKTINPEKRVVFDNAETLAEAAEAIKTLNKINENLGFGPWTTIDTNDTSAVREYCSQVAAELFQAGRRGHN